MATYDFSKTLSHRTGQEFTTVSIGLGSMANVWTQEADYHKPIKMGTVFELILLYTVDRRAQQRTPPNNVLSEEEKRDRYALAQKVRENAEKVDLEPREVELLKLSISVLGVEPNSLCHQFLDNPEI